MSPAGKLAGFAVVLGVALGGGAAVGGAAGPIDVDRDEAETHGGHDEVEAAGSASAPDGADEAAMVPGVLVSQGGYTLDAERTVLDGAPRSPFTFQITGRDGSAVREFEVSHERELHLIIVDRDLRSYSHLHPTLAGDGTWSTRLPALAPGAYRAYADFAVADGPELTLGVDLTVPGEVRPAPLPRQEDTVTVDGYDVALTGTPVAGTESELELTVSRGGEPVTDLEPYLGAAGHLVAIRAGDLAYLHVHPLDDSERANDPGVRFSVEVPSPGDYRLFFDFSHEGEVHNAAFTVPVPAEDEPTGGGAGAETSGEHGGHDTTDQEDR